MSKNFLSKEEAINQLYATIKSKFEQDGVLQEVRCMLQSKMVAMMRGKNETNGSLVQRHSAAGSKHVPGADGTMDAHRDPRIQLLHQLIMEYFHWHGFFYSAEMFAMESASENVRPVRECLEGVLGSFEHQDVPILLELVASMMEKKK